MENYLKCYKLRLKTISPIFIGAGKEINKKEYLYDREHGKIHILNIEKMYSDFLKDGLEQEFESYLMQRKKNLNAWFRERGMSWKDYSKWIQYSMVCSETEIGENEASIALFMKNKYGKPYIPGSSVKGALRTAIIGSELTEESNIKKYHQKFQNAFNDSRSRKKGFLGREMKKIEEDYFVDEVRNVKKNDKMSGIRISDSEPLPLDCLTICRKVDVKLDGEENRLNVFRECIKPGTEIVFDLSVDTFYNTYSVEEILDAINVFFDCCLIQSEKYEAFEENPENIMYLGGGSGFISKTIMYELFYEDMAVRYTSNILNQNFRKHHHDKDIRQGVSPRTKKCTFYDGKRYEFGLCKIDIQPI